MLCQSLNLPAMDTFADLDFPNMLGNRQAGIHARLLCLWASSQGQDPVVIDTISKLNKNISIALVSTRR